MDHLDNNDDEFDDDLLTPAEAFQRSLDDCIDGGRSSFLKIIYLFLYLLCSFP